MSTKCTTCGKGWIMEGEDPDCCKRCKAATAGPQQFKASDIGFSSSDAKVMFENDVIFYKPLEEPLKLDVFSPRLHTKESNRCSLLPAVLLFHGGGWTSGSKRDEHRMARRLATQGIIAVCVSYRLAPKHQFPAQLDDAASALAWVVAHAADYNLDPARIGLYGYSAGGHLAALLSLQPTSRVRCVAAGGAPWDVLAAPSEMGGLLWNLMGGSKAEKLDIWQRACPTATARAAAQHGGCDENSGVAVAFLLWHGTVDEVVPASGSLDMFADHLKAAGHTAITQKLHLDHLGAAIQHDVIDVVLDFLARELEADASVVSHKASSCSIQHETRASPIAVDPVVIATYRKVFENCGGDRAEICGVLDLDVSKWGDVEDVDSFCMKYLGAK